MSRWIYKKHPTQSDLNNQYGDSIAKTVDIYKRQKEQATYTFGNLTTEFLTLEDPDHYWKKDITDNYPEPIQALIKGVVEYALSQADPIKITWKFHNGGQKEVRVAYDDQKRSYAIDIYGYPFYK